MLTEEEHKSVLQEVSDSSAEVRRLGRLIREAKEALSGVDAEFYARSRLLDQAEKHPDSRGFTGG